MQPYQSYRTEIDLELLCNIWVKSIALFCDLQ